MNKVIETIPTATMETLSRYHWPGNIRELQNVIERAVIVSSGPELRLDFADLKLPKANSTKERTAAPNSKRNGALREVLGETERHEILEALKECNWVVAGPNGAAARLGIKRSTLQLRIQKLAITRQPV
jgi:formate hydrogenlyase transcriptional activator